MFYILNNFGEHLFYKIKIHYIVLTNCFSYNFYLQPEPVVRLKCPVCLETAEEVSVTLFVKIVKSKLFIVLSFIVCD